MQKKKKKLKPLHIEWGNLRHDEELQEILNPVKPLGADFARRVEHDIFEFLLKFHIAKIYIWDDYVCNDTTARWDFCFNGVPPENHSYREHDFNNLVQMSDEEFEQLVRSVPPSPNEPLVRQWREEMRNEYK